MTHIPEYKVIGYPIKHSLSPALHAAISAASGHGGRYGLEAIAPAALSARWAGLLDEFDGFNVTMPHKQAVLGLLDAVSDEAKRLAAVNTVYQNKGYNTDFPALCRLIPDPAGKQVLLLGYGGVARALAAAALVGGAAELVVCGRNLTKAQHFVAQVKQSGWATAGQKPVLRALSHEELAAELSRQQFLPQIVLQGTSAGQWPEVNALPLPENLVRQLLEQAKPTLYETIYNPAATRLMLLWRSAGLTAVGGLPMLFWQGLLARQIWDKNHDFQPAVAAEAQICAQLAAGLRSQYPTLIVLTGFMCAGKSSILRELAETCSRDNTDFQPLAVDLDLEIEQTAGLTIAEIFEQSGEAAFRDLEQAALQDVLEQHKTDHRTMIVATGGGALMQPGTVERIRAAQGRIVLLDVSLEKSLQRAGQGENRPMLSGHADFALRTATLYNARQSRYLEAADLIVDADQPVGQVTAQILHGLGWR